jgi:hypothetical protein
VPSVFDVWKVWNAKKDKKCKKWSFWRYNDQYLSQKVNVVGVQHFLALSIMFWIDFDRPYGLRDRYNFRWKFSFSLNFYNSTFFKLFSYKISIICLKFSVLKQNNLSLDYKHRRESPIILFQEWSKWKSLHLFENIELKKAKPSELH